MGIETALIGGALIGGVGSYMGARRQERAGDRAREDQMNQLNMINTMGQGMITGMQGAGANPYNEAMQSYLPQLMERQNTSYTPQNVTAQTYNAANAPDAVQAAVQGYNPSQASAQGYNAMGIDMGKLGMATSGAANINSFDAMMAKASLANSPERIAAQQINIGDIFNKTGYNLGNDALAQMLRNDPSKQLTATDNAMAEMMATGNAFNTSAQSANLQKLYGLNLNDAVSRIQGSTGRLGARFGSATQQNVGRSVERMLAEQNVLQGGMEQQAFESAQGRRMSAAQLLAQLETARRTSTIEAARATQSAAGLGLQGEQANQSAALQAALANQATGQQTNLANMAALNQFSLANQGAYNQAGMQTQNLQASAAMQANQLAAQMSQANLQARLAALGQNAAMGNEAAQFGAAAQNQAGLFNTQAQNAAAQFGAASQNEASSQYAAAQNQLGMFNANTQNQAGQFTANAMNQANQFNSQQGLAGYTATQNAQAQAVQQYLSALGSGNQMVQGQQGLINQIYGIMAGQNVPGANPAAGATWNAVGQGGGQLQDLVLQQWMMGQMGAGANPGAAGGQFGPQWQNPLTPYLASGSMPAYRP